MSRAPPRSAPHPPEPRRRPGGRARGGAPRGSKLLPLNAPAPVRVRPDEGGRPVLVHRGRRSLRVDAIREAWRIDDEWWRRAISRRYFAVVLENGGAVTLFQDLTEGKWYAQEG